MNKKIHIFTLGEFSIRYGDVIVSDQDNHSKKIWTLLEFLISFRNKEISSLTLIDLLWPEESSNIDPANALKTILHRTRKLLDKLGFEEDKLIVKRRDTFAWNNNIPFEIDAEEFERYYNLGILPNLTDEERLVYFKKAFELYKGDYLPKSAGDTWAIPLVTYYHSIYIKLIHELIPLLKKQMRYDEILQFCSFAAIIAPSNEFIQLNLILSLYETGNANAALSQYNHFINMMHDDYGITPTKDFSDVYKTIIRKKKNSEQDLSIIAKDLIEPNAKPQAFYCDYSIFQYLYQKETRSIVRSGLTIHLCLITIETRDYHDIKLLRNAMDKMSNVIATCLRSGDVYSRYSVNQFIIMLLTNTQVNCNMIGNRILKTYSETKPTLRNVNISYHIQNIPPTNLSP